MSAPDLVLSGDPGTVWRVGFAPDQWAWTPWWRAPDNGLFNGRWDDQNGRFRTLYTGDSLLGCLLEVLASMRPDTITEDELDAITDDDGAVEAFPDAAGGTVGYDWLEDRSYGRGQQTGRYCFITHSQTVGALAKAGVFARHGIAARAVDVGLLKDPRNRVLTRSIARWLYDLRDEDRRELIDGVEFRSRHGDDIRLWAIFERSPDEHHERSTHVTPDGNDERVTPENPDLLEAFRILGLHWPQT